MLLVLATREGSAPASNTLQQLLPSKGIHQARDQAWLKQWTSSMRSKRNRRRMKTLPCRTLPATSMFPTLSTTERQSKAKQRVPLRCLAWATRSFQSEKNFLMQCLELNGAWATAAASKAWTRAEDTIQHSALDTEWDHVATCGSRRSRPWSSANMPKGISWWQTGYLFCSFLFFSFFIFLC